MVKDHSASERRNPLLPLCGLLFPISSKGSFTCTIPQTGEYITEPLLHQLLLPIPVGLLVLPCTRQCRCPPPPLTPSPFFMSQTEELAKAGTFAHDRRVLQQLALNVHAKKPTTQQQTFYKILHHKYAYFSNLCYLF